MQFNDPRDKAQWSHSKLLSNKCKVNRDKWDLISFDTAKVMAIGQMNVCHIVKVIEEDVVDNIREDGMDEVDGMVVLHNMDEGKIR